MQIQLTRKVKWRHLVAKFSINASVVAKFSPSLGVNFWVRCASGNVWGLTVTRCFVHFVISRHYFWCQEKLLV